MFVGTNLSSLSLSLSLSLIPSSFNNIYYAAAGRRIKIPGLLTMTLPLNNQSSLVFLALTTVKYEAFHEHTNADISMFYGGLQVSKMKLFICIQKASF
ncbi:hypothetical protein VN97_g7028 [Penicillium thymicola]|uniref:Uncharacterized protein n=1 Tax=Penicillium thymicola TaxID=293382 RepID=A0AAI9X6W1_PENTH|nr:hypothetical protein VN97_g7028 [Penicillium thymicola]